MGWIIILAVGAVVIIANLVSNHFKQKRNEALAKRAQALGLEFYSDLPEADWDRLEEFELYKKHGSSQRVGMALAAETDDTRVTVCEYTYVVGSGKNKSSRTSVVLLVTDRRLNIPQIVLARKSWTASLAKLVGYRYIEFPEDPDFNACYLVRGESEESVREYLHEHRRKQLVLQQLESFEGYRDSFIVVHPGVWLQPSEIDARLSQSLAILKAIL